MTGISRGRFATRISSSREVRLPAGTASRNTSGGPPERSRLRAPSSPRARAPRATPEMRPPSIMPSPSASRWPFSVYRAPAASGSRQGSWVTIASR